MYIYIYVAYVCSFLDAVKPLGYAIYIYIYAYVKCICNIYVYMKCLRIYLPGAAGKFEYVCV